jgi:succinate-semialdehyde dehydrogenase/glutarate-semialdehyde dehydrogenase
VYVEAPVYDAYVAAASRAVTALRAGPRTSPETEFGAMIHADAARTIAVQRDDAVAKGARVVATASLAEGGKSAAHVAPVLLAEADETMLVLQEETFGPVLAVVKVRDADEAIRRANDSSFGLSASVWTSDRVRGLAVARRLQAGTVMINDASSVVGMADVPYGGVKESGIGRMHGEAGLEEFVRVTAVVDDRFTHWRQPWWFPYGAAHAAGIEAYARLAHGGSLLERLRGIPGTVRLVLTRKGTA